MSSNMILLAKSDMAQNWAACPNAYAGFGDIDPGRCDFDSSSESPAGVTTVLRGAAGFGKTTLAQAACQDDRIILAYGDGILWVTLGERPKVLDKLRTLYAALTGEHPPFHDDEDA